MNVIEVDLDILTGEIQEFCRIRCMSLPTLSYQEISYNYVKYWLQHPIGLFEYLRREEIDKMIRELWEDEKIN